MLHLDLQSSCSLEKRFSTPSNGATRDRHNRVHYDALKCAAAIDRPSFALSPWLLRPPVSSTLLHPQREQILMRPIAP